MPSSRQKNISFFAGLVVVALVVGHYSGITKPLERWLRSLTIPPLIGLHNFSVLVGTNYQFFVDKEAFFKAYRESTLQNQSLATTTAQLMMMANENELLRQLLNFQKRNPTRMLVVEVVGKELQDTDQNLLINRGTQDGLGINQPVIAGDGILVGKIIKVESDISIVRLINNNQSRVAATILNSDHSLGVVEGWFNVGLEMNLIPRNEVIRVGDQVVTSGLEFGMPRGLLLGKVALVKNESHQSFQQATLNSMIELSKLTTVAVLISTP